MPAAPIPADEPDRLTALACLAILDTPPEERFDRITRVAAALFGTAFAAINLIDAERQWTKSGVGLPGNQCPRDASYCAHVVSSGGPLIVADTLEDRRLRDLPFTTNVPFLRFYAGIPLCSTSGHVLGTLYIADRQPRVLAPAEEAHLRDLAAWAERELTNTELHAALERQQQSDRRFRAAAEATLDAFFIFESVRDAAGRITDFRFAYVNERAEKLVTIPRAKMVGQLLCELIPINRTGGFFEKYVRVVETQIPLEEEFCIDTPEVAGSWIHHQVVPLGDGIAITSRDVTARKQAEEMIAANTARLTAMVADLGARARTLTLLHELSDLLHGCDTLAEALDVVAMSAHALFPATSGALYVRQAAAAELTFGSAWGVPYGTPPVLNERRCTALRRKRVQYTPHGNARPVCQHHHQTRAGQLCVPLVVRAETLGVIHLLDHSDAHDEASLERDMQRDLARAMADQVGMALANIQLREELRRQALRDPLTGLYNRRYLDESFAREITRAARQKQPVSVLAVDIDHFKRFNDTWGHAAGDAILREVGRLLETSVRASDIAARAGGEEFVLVLPDAGLPEAVQRAEQLRQAVCALHVAHAPPLPPISISIGVAAFPAHGANAETLLHVADAALYDAKNSGRDRVCVGSPAFQNIDEALLTADALG
jgi:diguanylate cyclase (GGDEF)-like protein